MLSGCGSFTEVSGTVSYKGKNLTMGTVTFIGADGKKKGSTSIASDGKYKLIEPPLGQVRVAVQVKPPPKIANSKSETKLTIGNEPNEKAEPVLIPSIYADPGKSGLSTELKSGSNTYDIDLKEVEEKDVGPKKKGKK
ncbi:MAG: hypothetical protein L0Y71_21550 [Gemmataceae bacterium]|nr:hypothetical protein [Gemmataceae bacterium]